MAETRCVGVGGSFTDSPMITGERCSGMKLRKVDVDYVVKAQAVCGAVEEEKRHE